jgi:hypothetical protein
MPIRQFPRSLRARVRVAYAVAWEALVDTHTEQALLFIGEFASRLSPLDALELYFTVAPVSESMHEAIRTRTLSTIELDCLPPRAPLPVLRGWRLLRLDLVLKLIRYRRSYHEKTVDLAKMVGAQAAEKVTNTHVRNARELADLLASLMPVERAVAAYLQAFYLPLGAGQVVMQRVKAAVAGSHLALEYTAGPAPDPELLESPSSEELVLPPWDPAAGELLGGQR